jgi:hypothetical protein
MHGGDEYEEQNNRGSVPAHFFGTGNMGRKER